MSNTKASPTAHWVDLAEWATAREVLGSSTKPVRQAVRISQLTGMRVSEVILLSRRGGDEMGAPDPLSVLMYLSRGTLEQQVAVKMLLGEIPGDSTAYYDCRERAARHAAWQRHRRS